MRILASSSPSNPALAIVAFAFSSLSSNAGMASATSVAPAAFSSMIGEVVTGSSRTGGAILGVIGIHKENKRIWDVDTKAVARKREEVAKLLRAIWIKNDERTFSVCEVLLPRSAG